jgi:hypothetical protein
MMENFPPRASREVSPAFIGFFVAALALLVILSTIVRLTNAHFERVEAAATPPAAGATK